MVKTSKCLYLWDKTIDIKIMIIYINLNNLDYDVISPFAVSVNLHL